MADEVVLTGGNGFFDRVFEENLNQRKIILNDEISNNVVETMIMQILKFNEQDKNIPTDKRKPIFIYFCSPGGDVLTGLTTIDVIKNSKTPIYGVIVGYGYSMSALMFTACHKRIMLPSASLLIHDGSTTLSGSNNKVKDLQKFYGKLDEKVKNIVVNNSKITS
jgi:ATP-dependent Clp protease protease subunit